MELEAGAEPVKKLHEVDKMLEITCCMVGEESSARGLQSLWANECSANADSVSKALFEELVVDEERHFDQYDTELDNLDRFGKEYLVLQSIERSKARGAAGAE